MLGDLGGITQASVAPGFEPKVSGCERDSPAHLRAAAVTQACTSVAPAVVSSAAGSLCFSNIYRVSRS